MNQDNSTIILKHIPRLLSLLDRRKFSRTFGCFDRNYWHYRLVVDFPSSVYQQGTLSLALLYKNNFEGNVYYDNDVILEYIIAAVEFWAEIQNPDGSFNEWFPNEHSFVATAFTAYAISESLLLLKDEIDGLKEQKKQRFLDSLKKAANWLLKNDEDFVANHIAGAVPALHNIYLLTQEDRYIEGAKRKFEQILTFQDEEGWFREYKGVDLGYLSVSIDYLAKYYKKSKDPALRHVFEKALGFLKYFIHPDGSCSGEYASRNTKYLLLHGLKILSSEFRDASYILKRIEEGIRNEVIPSIDAFDDRYFSFFFLPNFLQYEFEKCEKLKIPDFDKKFIKVFKNSGLICVSNENYYFVCNAQKNAVFKIFSVNEKPGLFYSDSGYFAELSGILASSNHLDEGNVSIKGIGTETLCIGTKAFFVRMGKHSGYSKLLLLLRLFNKTFGRLNKAASFLNSFIKKNFILKKDSVPLELTRKIEVNADRIIVHDTIKLIQKKQCFALGLDPSSQAQFSPTSGYFIKSDLYVNFEKEDFSRLLNDKMIVEIINEFSWIKGRALMERKIK